MSFLKTLGCAHSWKIIGYGKLERSGSTLTAGAEVGYWTQRECTKCGCVRTRRTYNMSEKPE